MITRDIIVVGASAGGVAALKAFVKQIPKDFKGYIFIVLHIPAYTKSELPWILSQAGPLEAVHPKDGEAIQSGKIYIAPNDFHLILEEGRVLVKRGPKENRFRPCIDALFRSAAYVYKSRVIGIVLSGLLNDGTSGLWTIKRLGGIAIIQDPRDAEQPQMPENVIEYVEADYILPASEMGPLIADLITERAPEKIKFSEEELGMLKVEVAIATNSSAFEMGIVEMGELTPLTCPECHGALVRLIEGSLVRFRCHTGHAYTASALLSEVTESVEAMLWQSMRGMEELTMILNGIGSHFERLNNEDAAEIFRNKAKDSSKRARVIHASIFRQEHYSEDLRLDKEDIHSELQKEA
jgi:two-component system chemotaxis response regulator CheB